MTKFVKIISIALLFFICNSSFSQIKQRTVSTSFYTGLGYKFVFLTNKQARDNYPFFQLSNGNFLKEIDGLFGVTINESYSIEFAPAYLYSNSVSNDGFYYNDASGNRFYVPTQSRLFALPLNVRFKYYPFAKNYNSSLSKFYVGGGGGAMYFDEEVTSQVYLNENKLNYLGAKTGKDNFWTSNFEILVGFGSFSKIGYGFELSYRIVPLSKTFKSPVVTDIVSDFNSVNLAANIIYTF